MAKDQHPHDRTGHGQALSEEEKNNEHHRRMVALNPQVPWVADAQGRLLDFSPQWLTLTGLTREQALTVGWSTIPHPEDLPYMLAAWEVSLTTGAPLDTEHRIRTADGTFRWMRTRAFAQRDSHGEVAFWYGYTEDIHQRVQTEQALRASESRYRSIIETALEGVWVVDARYTTTFVNTRMAALLGYTCEEMIGRSVLDFIRDQDRGVIYERMHQRATGEAGQYDARFQRKDGSLVWVMVSATPLIEEEDRFAGAVALMTDITERKQLEIQQARLAAIVDSSQDAIVSKDLEGIITSWNAAAERLYGWTAREIVGRSKALVIPPDLPNELSSILARIKAGERIEQYETRRLHKNGTLLEVSISVSPVKNRQGQVIGAATIVRDITPARQQQKELALLNNWLQRAMRETHHRVKNNLQVMGAMLDIVSMDYVESVPIAEVMRIAHHAKTLAEIHDILTREARSLDESETQLSAREVLLRLLLLLEKTAPHFDLAYEIEEVLLSLRQVTALALVLNELVLNAMKYGHGRIEVQLGTEGHSVRLVVEDDGPGLSSLFNPSLDSNTGLQLVSLLADNDLEGSLTFENRPSGGTRVCLAFPRQEEQTRPS